MHTLKAVDFQDALRQIPIDENVEYVGVFFQSAEARNNVLATNHRQGNFYFHEYPEQLNYCAAIRQGAQMFYGWGDIPKTALLNAIYSFTSRAQIFRDDKTDTEMPEDFDNAKPF